jgi:transcriptional regulator with XRE-family HTH domain
MKPQPTTPRTGTAKFGEALRKHRKTADMSIVDLAKSAGLSEPALSRIETGASRPPELNTLMRMANALGIPQGSDEFEELWRLAEQERHPDQDASKFIAAMQDLTRDVLKELVEDLHRTDAPPSKDRTLPVLPEFVPDVSGLIAKSNKEIAQRGASAMTVHFPDGTTKTWRVLGTTPSSEHRDV